MHTTVRYNMGIFIFIYLVPIIVMATLYTRVSMELNKEPEVGERIERRQAMRIIERKKVFPFAGRNAIFMPQLGMTSKPLFAFCIWKKDHSNADNSRLHVRRLLVPLSHVLHLDLLCGRTANHGQSATHLPGHLLHGFVQISCLLSIPLSTLSLDAASHTDDVIA